MGACTKKHNLFLNMPESSWPISIFRNGLFDYCAVCHQLCWTYDDLGDEAFPICSLDCHIHFGNRAIKKPINQKVTVCKIEEAPKKKKSSMALNAFKRFNLRYRNKKK